jgi:hypothetical protein
MTIELTIIVLMAICQMWINKRVQKRHSVLRDDLDLAIKNPVLARRIMKKKNQQK